MQKLTSFFQDRKVYFNWTENVFYENMIQISVITATYKYGKPLEQLTGMMVT